MKYYSSLVPGVIVLSLLSGLMIYWGIRNDGIIRIIFGILIFLGMLLSTYFGVKRIIELKNWIIQNEDKIVLFYPCKKKNQIEIESIILPLLPEDCLRVYYEGPALSGNIKRSIAIELMYHYKEIKVNSPSLFKFKGKEIHLEKLPELMNLNSDQFDFSELKIKMDRLIRM